MKVNHDTCIVLATHNQGKVAEFQALLAPLSCSIVPLSDFSQVSPEETGSTFIENALIKAKFASAVSGLPALADDSGLVVPFLGGAPGIHSARYAGEPTTPAKNMAKLCQALTGQREANRSAHFHCSLVLLQHADDPAPVIAEGIWQGHILPAPVGTQGFGYDPIFNVASLDKSAATLSMTEKNHLSHRAQACRKLLANLT